MAIWKMTTRCHACLGANLRIEKGMSIEMMVQVGNPLGTPKSKEQACSIFNNKYGTSLEPKHISASYFDCEKISG